MLNMFCCLLLRTDVRGMFATLTGMANDTMKLIHNHGDNKWRMPLFLPKELEVRWLDPKLTDAEMIAIISFEMSSSELDYHTVYSVRGRTPRPDHKPKNELFVFDNCPPLGDDDRTIKTQLELF